MSKSPPPYPWSPPSTRPHTLPHSLLNISPFPTTSRTRLQSLYSDIARQQHSSPDSYHANIEWWRRAIESLVGSGTQGFDGGKGKEAEVERTTNKLILRAGRELVDSLRIEGVGKPLGLGAVVTDLRRRKSLIPLTQFITAKQSVYDPGSLTTRIVKNMVGKPLWWALEQMGIVSEEGSSGSAAAERKDWWGEHVVLSLVERAADAVVEKQRGRGMDVSAALYGMEGFRQAFEGVLEGVLGVILSEVDVKVLVRYLERDRGVLVVDKDVIKFVDKDVISEAREITAVDRGILELKNAVESMHAQIDGIQLRMDECTQKASAALRRKQRPVALSHLKAKKLLEDMLMKRLSSLGVLESTLIRVEGAAGDVEIMKSYESSTATLHAILTHPSMQRDKIEETMDAMAEASADAKDVDEAIRMGGDIALGVEDDDDELQEELEALVDEVEGERLENEKAWKLEGVNVPAGDPVMGGGEGERVAEHA